MRYSQLGCYFSVPNTAAKDGAQSQNMIKLLPLEKLLLETDSPALSFEPGKMNQPKNLRISAEIIAKIKKVDVDTVIKQTTLNAFKLFPRNGFIRCSGIFEPRLKFNPFKIENNGAGIS